MRPQTPREGIGAADIDFKNLLDKKACNHIKVNFLLSSQNFARFPKIKKALLACVCSVPIN